jgi:ferritin-like metal-binding protein YciE
MEKKRTTKFSSDGHSSKSNSKNDAATALSELFEEQLKDIYWAEKALVKAIPKMAKKAMNDELISALESHLEETKEQVNRLDEVFASIGKRAQGKECHAMKGLIEEAEEMMEETEGVVRDAAIIGAAQKVEHYEIATYGTLRAFALALGFSDAAELLEQTLDEEKGADEKLTAIAESAVNEEALRGGENEEDEEQGDEETMTATRSKTSRH